MKTKSTQISRLQQDWQHLGVMSLVRCGETLWYLKWGHILQAFENCTEVISAYSHKHSISYSTQTWKFTIQAVPIQPQGYRALLCQTLYSTEITGSSPNRGTADRKACFFFAHKYTYLQIWFILWLSRGWDTSKLAMWKSRSQPGGICNLTSLPATKIAWGSIRLEQEENKIFNIQSNIAMQAGRVQYLSKKFRKIYNQCRYLEILYTHSDSPRGWPCYCYLIMSNQI